MANRSVWLIFFEGIKIFALNIHKFMLYMAFPVLGQILGIFLIFGLTFWFTQNMQDIAGQIMQKLLFMVRTAYLRHHSEQAMMMEQLLQEAEMRAFGSSPKNAIVD